MKRKFMLILLGTAIWMFGTSSVAYSLNLDIEMQYRLVSGLNFLSSGTSSSSSGSTASSSTVNLSNFPNPFALLFGVAFTTVGGGGVTLTPEAGLILSGSEFSQTVGGVQQSAGAFGGGAYLRAIIGIGGASRWYFMIKPELSYIALFGQSASWTLLEFGTGVGFGVNVYPYNIYFELLRFGVRPGTGSLLFLSTYPSFGLRFSL